MENCTYTSVTKDTNGNSWCANFEFFPFHEGKHMASYRGSMFVPGDYFSETKTVVKVPRTARFTKNIPIEVHIAEKAQSFIEDFLGLPAVVDYIAEKKGCKLRFTKPMASKMESISGWNAIFSLFMRVEKKLKKREWVLIEERLKGEFRTFIDDKGYCSSTGRLLPAFCHFSYAQSDCALVVCNLKGVQTGRSFVLSVPTIHSVDTTYGQRDEGPEAITSFFTYHHCNSLCETLAIAM